MKQKIEQFANGVFSYEKPSLLLSEDMISLDAVSGQQMEGSFIVQNDMNRSLRGFCISECPLVSFKNESFEGVENNIEFVFDARNLDAGIIIKTVIEVISDSGETEIGLNVRVVSSYIDTSVGQTYDLFHYANLAMSSPQEAKDLFKSESFKDIVIEHSPEYKNLYRNLAGAANTALALEEFLIATKKKKPVEFSVDANELVYEAGTVTFMDKIAIKKNNWGYAQLRVDTEGDFIETERSLIWAEDFEDGIFWLKFVINPDKLRYGRSYGKIIISTLGDEVDIPVICVKSSPTRKNMQLSRKKKEYEVKLANNHISYMLGQCSAAEYVKDAEGLLAIFKTFRREGGLEKLYRIFLEFLSGNEKKAREAFESLDIEAEAKENIVLYAARLYVKGIISEKYEDKNDACLELRKLYENERSLSILLFYIGLDGKERLNKKQRYEELKYCYEHNGERSVYGLVEAAKIVSSEPILLKELGEFERCVVLEVVRRGLKNKYFELQLSYIAGKEKNTSPILLEILKQCYGDNKLKETLEAVCTHIILGGKDLKKEYEWLKLGVNEQLRINRLYEKCLEAADSRKELLPRPVLNYFATGADLKPELATVLYSNILRFCNKSDNIYTMHKGRMKEFAKESLSKAAFNSDLALIYEKMLEPEDLDDRMIACLPYILYKHEIKSDWKKVKTVSVFHKEMNEPEFVKAENGVAIADIYTDDPVIVMLDDEGDRCVASFRVEVSRMIQRNDLQKLMYEKCRDDRRVLLNRLEAAKYEGQSDEIIESYVKCSEVDYLDDSFMLECRKSLVEYYYDNLEGELLEANLVQLDLRMLGHRDRIKMIEFMIFRELYSLALKNMELFGFYDINPKRLTKLCSSLLMMNSPQTSSRLFMKLCEYCFLQRKQDDLILSFLEKNYDGSTQALYDLWVVCRDAGIETADLEERMLKTALFTENDMNFVKDVFKIYYGHCSSGKLVRAYLSYLAYGHLVCDNMLDREILEIMRKEANYSENDICMLSILKDYSTRKSFTEQEKTFIEFQLKRMENKGLLMPFFKNFPEEIHIPRQMRDKYYVEYHTEQGRKVRIHYCFVEAENDEGFADEDMKDIGFGIYVKEFILFYGEAMQYYITELGTDQNIITESREVSLEPELYGCEENRYHQLNLIITAKKMDDEKTVIKLIENYALNDYAVKRLFTPI